MMKADKKSYVYILTNKHRTVVYVGCTDELRKRIYFHRKRLIPGFTKKYNVDRLVYVEEVPTTEAALSREKQIKKYRREKKNQLIESVNPEWNDLYRDFMG